MKIQTMMMLERDEKHLIRRLEEALNLVGWHQDRAEPSDEIKSINRIRGDQFSMHDLGQAERYVRRKAAEIEQRAAEQPDPRFREGARSTAKLAIRQLETFLADIEELRLA